MTAPAAAVPRVPAPEAARLPVRGGGDGDTPRPDQGRQALLRLAGGCVLPLLALAIQRAAWQWLAPHAWILFYPAVFVAASLCGPAAGVLATLVSVPVVRYGFLVSHSGLGLADPAAPYELAVFVLSGLAVSWIAWRNQNVTRRLLRTESRLQGELHVARIVDAAMDAIVSIDAQQRIVQFNHAAEQMFGLAASAAMGQTIDVLLPMRHRGMHQQHIERYLSSGATSRRMGRLMELSGLRADGHEFPIEAAISKTGSGGQLLATVVLRDVSERLAMQQRVDGEAQRVAKHFRALYERTPAMIHSIDSQGRLQSVSDAWTSKLGYPREEVIGRHVTDFMTPASREAVLSRHLPRHLQDRSPARGIEFELVCKDGSTIEVALSSIQDRHLLTGEEYRLGVLEDVTVRNRTLRALRESEARYRLLVEDQSELVSLSAPDGELLFVNRAYAESYGRAASEMVGTNLYDYLEHSERELVRERRAQVMRLGIISEGEDSIRSPDGRLRWIAWTNRGVTGEDGRVLSLHSVGRDITAHKALEASLEASRTLLAKIGNVAGIGGWKLDVSRGDFVWSEQCCRIVGLPRRFQPSLAEMIAFYAPEVREDVRARIALACRDGVGFDQEFRFLRVDGRSIWVRTVVSVESEGGAPARVIGAFHDVTVERAQRLRVEQLYEQSEQQRGQLADFRSRAQSEAELANFLLSRLTRVEQLDDPGVSHFWVPAETFSGDVIAAARSSTGDLYGLLADATGHGLAAAINLIPLTSAFYAMAAKGFNLRTIAEQINQVVKDYSLADRFVAVTLARFVRRDQQLEIVNAGNPRALLVDRTGRVTREFRSGCVPLGILPRATFHPVVETVALAGDEELVLFSDGVVEACNAAGEPFGQAGVDAALSDPRLGASVVTRLQAALLGYTGQAAQADDVSVLVLRQLWSTGAAPQVASAGSPGMPVGPAPPGELALEDTPSLATTGAVGAVTAGSAPTWSMQTVLSWRELRSLELVPLIVGFTRSLGLDSAAEGSLFTVLSELFVNALDHGLLAMDSRLKSQPDGFERYFECRAERLAALDHGSITVTVEHAECADGRELVRVQVADTGPGFEHEALVAALTDRDGLPSTVPSGRGLPLLRQLCERLTFNATGNCATAELECQAAAAR